MAALPSAYAFEPRLQASLVTCRPGPEVYELFGHEALRIRGIDEKGEAVDSVWNYGVFDFASPGFLYRFVKGETDYMLYPCPTPWFLASYQQRGSGVVEQDLALTPEETLRLRRLLQINALPANRTYRYNYVRDNCSTRVADIIDSALTTRTVIYPDTLRYATFREAMRDFHKDYLWYQFGIDLVLGGGLDVPLQSRQELFAPTLMEAKAADAHFSDGKPFVAQTNVLLTGDPDGIRWPDGTFASSLLPTPWWATPLAVSILVMLISFCVAFMQWKKRRLYRIYNTVFFSLLALAGCIVWFLVFFSTHDSTSPNLLALWLNPLQSVVALCIWWRHTRPAAVAMSVVDIIVLILLTGAWPLQQQVANPAVFPLWAATFALTLSLASTYPALRRKDIDHKYPAEASRIVRTPRKRSTASGSRTASKRRKK